MMKLLLTLGLAAIIFNPSLALEMKSLGNNEAIENTTLRVIEPAASLTLKAALELAYSANAALSTAKRELEAVTGSILQAGLLPNPRVEALIEDPRPENRLTAVYVNLPLELGGKRPARVAAAERRLDVASAELNAMRAEIRAAVMVAFFDVLVAQERFLLTQGLVELSQRATTAASKRVTAGKISPVEETKARVAEASVRVELSQASTSLKMARKRLTAIWGNATPRFERAEGQVETLPALPALKDLTARLANAPGLARAQLEVDRRQALVEVERSLRIPDMTVSLGGRRNAEIGLNQALLGVSLPIPIFNRNQGNILEALRRTDKARDELSGTEIRLHNEIAQALERLNVARQEIEVLQQEILPGAQNAYDAATKGFIMGKFSFLEVLDAQRTLFQAKSQYLRALAEAHRSAAEIERVLGETPDDSTLR
ncbi:Cobalt-zinc-cadmium resistance protein CzcC [Candidatus Nitrotoga sp. HW29]|uniref:TolC family protein n=1 Tax=Candidatus Nitrotoga sp. HW29 TaxID=2886963 RepID=UPI001EF3BE84|nr:TolC family protein [Candidatus Nitrotoga sp. HW29]CAH1906001.1 Cobalt-zinc-cadmium resistance protein CzcC [Candidatus Nitrotoga sp. HW29]